MKVYALFNGGKWVELRQAVEPPVQRETKFSRVIQVTKVKSVINGHDRYGYPIYRQVETLNDEAQEFKQTNFIGGKFINVTDFGAFNRGCTERGINKLSRLNPIVEVPATWAKYMMSRATKKNFSPEQLERKTTRLDYVEPVRGY